MKIKIPLITLLFTITACKVQNNIAGSYTYKTECLGVELDGSQTVKTWGTGKNKADAVEQAKKHALRDVLFNGILEGKDDCEKKPLITEVNAQQKHEDYFNDFFADSGDYKRFISLRDEPKGKRDEFKSRKNTTIGLIVRVLRADLKKKLIKDGILK